jgi:hypothetical protein
MTRREFLRRSAPMVAAGLVTPWFVEAVMRRLFPPQKYWDMGAGGVRYIDIFVKPVQPVELIEMDIRVIDVTASSRKLKYRWDPKAMPLVNPKAMPLVKPGIEQHLVDHLARQIREVERDQA